MSDDSTVENSIVKTSELGQAIIAEAQKRYDEQRREGVLSLVQRLMQFRDESIRIEKRAAAATAWYRKKLAAIDAGEFSMDRTTGAMTFIDTDLDRPNY